MNIHSKDQSGPRPTFWQLNLLFDGRQKRSELPCDKRLLTWPCSFEIPSSGVGDSSSSYRTAALVVYNCLFFFFFFLTQLATETCLFKNTIFPFDCASLFTGGQIGTKHKSPGLTHSNKKRRHQSNLYSNTCLCPAFRNCSSPNCSLVWNSLWYSTDVDHFWPEGQFALLIWLVFWFLCLCQNHPGLSTLGVYTAVDVAMCMKHMCVCVCVCVRTREDSFYCLFRGAHN